jgi:hypothetical protein
VVSYQGYPIIQKSIDVSEPAAPASVEAAPTEGGVPLWAGIAIIAVLVLAAVVLLVAWKLKKTRATI